MLNVVHFGESFSQRYVVCIWFVWRVVIWFSGSDFCCAVGVGMEGDGVLTTRGDVECLSVSVRVFVFLFLFEVGVHHDVSFAVGMSRHWSVASSRACGRDCLSYIGIDDQRTVSWNGDQNTESWRCMTKRCVVTRSTTTSFLPCLRFLAYLACLFMVVRICVCVECQRDELRYVLVPWRFSAALWNSHTIRLDHTQIVRTQKCPLIRRRQDLCMTFV